MKFKGLFFILVIAIVYGCGLKKSPQPPLSIVPSSADSLEIEIEGSCINLAWSVKEEQVPESWLLYRERAKHGIASGAVREFVCVLGGNNFSYQDCGLATHYLYRYELIPKGRFNQKGDGILSPWALVLDPPIAPEEISLNSGDHFVELSWNFDGADCYFIYRYDDGINNKKILLTKEPVLSKRFLDASVENDKCYHYQICPALLPEGYPPIKGACSKEKIACPKDLIAPVAPRGLIATITREGVLLRWLSNSEPDLSGYKVYRKRSSEKKFTLLTPEPISSTSYLDKKAILYPGASFEYAISAVDNSKQENESKKSSVEKIFIPRKY